MSLTCPCNLIFFFDGLSPPPPSLTGPVKKGWQLSPQLKTSLSDHPPSGSSRRAEKCVDRLAGARKRTLDPLGIGSNFRWHGALQKPLPRQIPAKIMSSCYAMSRQHQQPDSASHINLHILPQHRVLSCFVFRGTFPHSLLALVCAPQLLESAR